MSEVLPPYWYQLQGEGLDYLSGLLGLDENTTTYLLKMMGVLKDHGESVRFEHTDTLNMVGAEVEVEISTLATSMSTRRSGPVPRKRMWFLRIGSRSEDYNRISYNKASEQV